MADEYTDSTPEENSTGRDDEQKTPLTLDVIRNEHGDRLSKNAKSELVLPAVGVLLYSVPAILALGRIHNRIHPMLFSVLSAILIVAGIGSYSYFGAKSGDQDGLSEAYQVEKTLEDWPLTFPTPEHSVKFDSGDELDDNELQMLLTEYETISQEARYRDRLINRSTYFALAVLAGFGAIITEAKQFELPVLMLLLSLAMVVFAMALIKYKDARDPLWKRQRDLERLVPALRGKLTTFHTIRTPSRRLLDRFSMSSYLINIYLGLTFLSILAYLYFAIQLPH